MKIGGREKEFRGNEDVMMRPRERILFGCGGVTTSRRRVRERERERERDCQATNIQPNIYS